MCTKEIRYGTGPGRHTCCHRRGTGSYIQNSDNRLCKQNIRRSQQFQLKSRSGSYIAEAALVLPVIILAVITVILVLMFFYEQSFDQSMMHIYLRSEAGAVTERLTCSSSDWNGTCTTEKKGVFKNIEGQNMLTMLHRGLLNRNGHAYNNGSWHAADGVAFRRAQGVLE